MIRNEKNNLARGGPGWGLSTILRWRQIFAFRI